ncbi:precorrin-2 dehydrogenase/sirohydrochlorin ferrochelatase family protein [Carboxylicivirga marina]|uniref:precorrin-2 dehydrogenase n=1 Tax=Carboxylicivirga marina TaxID=2800988 RepID=A0ABS1HHT4_9BACT|nr:NAD(P)-dependent oxidoreductase [Carboxylicivirga marina]MBK3517199.1 bifunctional precorrin-2 dehydrogenase/sirohydrochlorin ferrochelatase [Carboxylicivirga marina]
MNFLPISINIEDETILIIGGGHLAVHKVESLERFTHKIKVIATNVVPELLDRSFVEVEQKQYEPSDLEGHLLVYAATNNKDLNEEIRRDGKRFRCIVNVVDKPQHCDFVSPAIFRQGNMTVAVSSNGENVYAAIKWRNQIREMANAGTLFQLETKEVYRQEFLNKTE